MGAVECRRVRGPDGIVGDGWIGTVRWVVVGEVMRKFRSSDEAVVNGGLRDSGQMGGAPGGG